MHGRTTHRRSQASLYGRPEFFVGIQRTPILCGRAKKGSMRASRGWCGFYFSGRYLRPILSGLVLGVALQAAAQGVISPDEAVVDTGLQADVVAVQPAIAEASLPEAPEPQQQSKPDPDANKPLVAAAPKLVSSTTQMPVAPKFSKYIPAGYAVEQIHGREKLVMGARDLYSIGDVGDWFFSAGWEQIWNSQPNYGTDRGAFGERLGAAALRESSEGILTDGVFCVMLHEDPRYFVQGPQTGFVHRALYVVTRPLITRSSNDGHAKPNYALWLGLASAMALSNAYYPQVNRNAKDTVSRFAGSVGGSALGYAFDEFEPDLMRMLHLKHGQSSTR